ncbi:MAG: tyrosine-type recombinase/integrase [Candidatus Spechtbacterales bacterium]|nr:tyrosine-type recombinase/integrase [Candidatus Spechtbacterales bacterium]
MNKSNKPIPEHITDFLDYCEIEKGLANKTQENYARYLKVFVKWLKKSGNDSLLPHQLTPDHIWKYRLYLSRKHKTPSGDNLKKITQNYYLVALRALLDYFTDRDITSLPSSKIKLPKGAKQETVKFLTLDQMKKLMETPDTRKKGGLRDRAIIETLFSTGLRISELVDLNRDQINFKNMDEGLELTITGKGNATRTVYFSPRALKWLKMYTDSREDTDPALFINYRSRGDTDSRRLSKRYIEQMVKKYGKLAGLPVNVTPHVLRHSYATDLLTQGVDLRTVQEFLGHKNIATTQIYTHVTSKRLKDIHKKFHGGNRLEE